MSTFISEFLLGGNGKRVAIKDSIDIAGHPTRSGSRAFAVAAEEEFADERTHAFSSVLNKRCVRKCAISQTSSTQRKSMVSRVPNNSLRPSA